MILLLAIREVYGKQIAYPANDTAELFARIAGTKTITQDTLELINQLENVDVEFVTQTVNLH